MKNRMIIWHIKTLLKKPLKKFHRLLIGNKGVEKEILWANIFRDTIADSSWLKNKTFSLGRAAAGYPTMYAMYRILNEVQPAQILELGLGQSTRMISQYALACPNIQHTVVEHNASWVQFFEQQFAIPANTKIQFLDLETVSLKRKKKYLRLQKL